MHIAEGIDLTLRPHAARLREDLAGFLSEEVFPIERQLTAEMDAVDGPAPFGPLMTDLRRRAAERGLWNLFLPERHGGTLNTVEYAYLCELLGRYEWAASVVNCNFPDTGNSEVIADHGSPTQRQRWLEPMLAGDIRTCFAMTEPDVSSSDPTGITTRATKDGEEWVIDGHKWFASGAVGADLCMVMTRTSDTEDRHRRLTVFLVPMDSPGLTVVRRVGFFGHAAGPGHAELVFDGCRVGPDALLGEVGGGFAIAQDRLGPGRIHHCMRSVGAAERALEMTIDRARSRAHRGGVLADEPIVADMIARSRIDIDAARLTVLRAAHSIDVHGKRAAYRDISIAKVFVPEATVRVIDRAMQIHGALGMSDDLPPGTDVLHRAGPPHRRRRRRGAH